MASTLAPFVPAYRQGLASTPVLHAPEASGQDFGVGAILVNSSGKLAEGTPTANQTYSATIVGISLGAASGVADTDVAYCPALPDVVFEISVDDSNAQGTATAVLAASTLFSTFNVAGDETVAGEYWYLDVHTTTNPVLTVVGFKLRDNSTATSAAQVNGRVYVSFVPGTAIWA